MDVTILLLPGKKGSITNEKLRQELNKLLKREPELKKKKLRVVERQYGKFFFTRCPNWQDIPLFDRSFAHHIKFFGCGTQSISDTMDMQFLKVIEEKTDERIIDLFKQVFESV